MPAAARWTPPVTGASSVSMPLAAARLERRCSSCVSLVLMSIQVPPGASASRTPPSSATTEATASGDGRHVMIVSEARAVSAIDSAQVAPALPSSTEQLASTS